MLADAPSVKKLPPKERMEPMIPDDDVEILAREMMKHFPEDGAARALVRSEALALAGLGHGEKSKKWRLVSLEIEKIQGIQARSLSCP